MEEYQEERCTPDLFTTALRRPAPHPPPSSLLPPPPLLVAALPHNHTGVPGHQLQLLKPSSFPSSFLPLTIFPPRSHPRFSRSFSSSSPPFTYLHSPHAPTSSPTRCCSNTSAGNSDGMIHGDIYGIFRLHQRFSNMNRILHYVCIYIYGITKVI